MAINEEVKSLTEDIEASYETRIAAVADLVKETHQTLGNFKREHEEMANDLKRSLASSRREHEEIARDLKRSLASNRLDRVSQVQKTLADFSADHRQARTHWEDLTNVMAAKKARKLAHEG